MFLSWLWALKSAPLAILERASRIISSFAVKMMSFLFCLAIATNVTTFLLEKSGTARIGPFGYFPSIFELYPF
jgi:hypothetical protein